MDKIDWQSSSPFDPVVGWHSLQLTAVPNPKLATRLDYDDDDNDGEEEEEQEEVVEEGNDGEVEVESQEEATDEVNIPNM